MSRTRFRMNLHSIVYECQGRLAVNRLDIQSLSKSKGIRTHKHLVRKRTPNHLPKLARLAKWLGVRLSTKWLWVRIALLSPKL